MNGYRKVNPTKSFKVLFVLAIALCHVGAYADVITVPGNYSTIRNAIEAAVDGDEIIVSEGIYYENIVIKDKNIILRSTDPGNPDVVARAFNG